MTRPLTLQDFAAPQTARSGAAPKPGAEPVLEAPPAAGDDDALEAFESGYKNGWDDCLAAESENQRRIGADLAANLQDFSYTHADARRDVLDALGPLFEQMASQLLPALAVEAVAPAVIAELQTAAERATDGTATLIAAPGAVTALERLAEEHSPLSVSVSAEPAYAEGQVSLRFAAEERHIDLTEAADRMAAAIRAFVADAAQTSDFEQKGST